MSGNYPAGTDHTYFEQPDVEYWTQECENCSSNADCWEQVTKERIEYLCADHAIYHWFNRLEGFLGLDEGEIQCVSSLNKKDGDNNALTDLITDDDGELIGFSCVWKRGKSRFEASVMIDDIRYLD